MLSETSTKLLIVIFVVFHFCLVIQYLSVYKVLVVVLWDFAQL